MHSARAIYCWENQLRMPKRLQLLSLRMVSRVRRDASRFVDFVDYFVEDYRTGAGVVELVLQF